MVRSLLIDRHVELVTINFITGNILNSQVDWSAPPQTNFAYSDQWHPGEILLNNFLFDFFGEGPSILGGTVSLVFL